MIDRVFAKNFKGLNFDQPLAKRTLITGPNGSGKTARTQAMILAVSGSIPGVTGINPKDIIRTVGNGKPVTVGITHRGSEYVREYLFGRTGNPRQRCRRDGKICPVRDFNREAANLPTVFDLRAFDGSYPSKRIPALMAAFPPSDDINVLELEIQKQQARLKANERDLRDSYRLVSKIHTELAKRNRPSGTSAQKRKEIKAAEDELVEAKLQLRELRKDISDRKEQDLERIRKEKLYKHAHNDLQAVIKACRKVKDCFEDCPLRATAERITAKYE
jgi:DNA repair exonuclease SbcCD ATPase subunit